MIYEIPEIDHVEVTVRSNSTIWFRKLLPITEDAEHEKPT